MQRLLSIALSCLFAVTLSAQTEYPYPYNPDGNNDGLISIQDLMSLLSIYGEEYSAGVLATDSISAVYYTGELDYWDCTSSCVALTGNWKVLDHLLIGSYKTEIQEAPSSAVWQDHMTRMYDDHDPPALSTNSFSPTTYYVSNEISCFCQTRTRADIEDINLCEGLEDECGVCNGEGAIYECGCTDIPEGDCDCNGNQLDAVGVCGGDCLEDLDGDGVCDPVLGPCEGQDFVSYNGYDYDIVEMNDGRCWFAENLQTHQFSDGTPIEESSGENWVCYESTIACEHADFSNPQYMNIMNATFVCCNEEIGYSGFKYNGGVVNNTKNVCPVGWKVPTIPDYNALQENYNTPELFVKLVGNEYAYLNDVLPYEGISSSGLNLVTRTYINKNNGNLTLGNSDVKHWARGDMPPSKDQSRVVRFHFTDLSPSTTNILEDNSMGFSIRCIKD